MDNTEKETNIVKASTTTYSGDDNNNNHPSVYTCDESDTKKDTYRPIDPTNDNNNQQIDDNNNELTTDELPKIAISSLIDKYENTSTYVDSDETSKVQKIDVEPEKTICLNNRLYLLINNGLFLLEYSYSKFNPKNNIHSSSLSDRQQNSSSRRSSSTSCYEEAIKNDSLHKILNDGTDNEDFYKIINVCQPTDFIRFIVRCENENFEPTERNYICIIDNNTLKEGVFLGITIDSKNEIHIGLVTDYNHIELVKIVGDGCIHLNLKFEHSKSIKISPIQNFWRTLQYLPTWCDQYNNIRGAPDPTKTDRVLKKSRSSIGMASKEFNLLNTVSTVNRYLTKLSKNNRITFLWHNNDYHTSELLEDTLMEIDDIRKEYKKQLTELLLDIMTVPNAGDLTLTAIYEELSKRFNEDLKPYKCFIANETIRIYGKMEEANEILPHLFLGSDFNASDINFLKSHNITHVLNATKEVNNFYVGTLVYFNVSVYDRPESNILPFFNDCYRFIENARESGSNILVHCHMGISRSASVVIAYLIKKFKYTYDEAYNYVKARRSLVKPNYGFIKQLRIYEGMVHNKRENFESNAIDNTNETVPQTK